MTAKDPVCGMDVGIATAEWKTEYEGRVSYFCAPGCKRSFEAEPDKYVEDDARVNGGDVGHAPG